MTFWVPGVAATAGSKRAYTYLKAGGGIGARCEDSAIKRGRPWRKLVREMVTLARTEQPWDVASGVPLRLDVEFIMPRPKSHYRRDGGLKPNAPVFHTVRPDATKLLRCIEDAMTSMLWKDDAAIVDQHVVKRYGEVPGAQVTVEVIGTEVPAVEVGCGDQRGGGDRAGGR